jgi:hypothetical protein
MIGLIWPYCKVDGFINSSWKHKAIVVIGMLTDKVDPSGRLDHQRFVAVEVYKCCLNFDNGTHVQKKNLMLIIDRCCFAG